TDGDIIPLMLTCRLVYKEAIDVLYTTNTFSFNDLDCLRYFKSTIPPRAFDRIWYLDISWVGTWWAHVPNTTVVRQPRYPPYDRNTWEDTWRIVSEIPQLKGLRVEIIHESDVLSEVPYSTRDERAQLERTLLAPLRNITTEEYFDVTVNWSG
ncbi:hypothetical protein M011DRAFT_384380, partial [Sporormia fimetaria CBS 119925]